MKGAPLTTPDGRYLVIRGRLWRTSNPGLAEEERRKRVNELMDARRAVQKAQRDYDTLGLAKARSAVHDAKVALGERGVVWWNDGQGDFNRHMAQNSPYATWYASTGLSEE